MRWEVLDLEVELAWFCGKWSWYWILEDQIEFLNHLSCDQYTLFKSIFLVIKCIMYLDQLTRLLFDRTSKTALANFMNCKTSHTSYKMHLLSKCNFKLKNFWSANQVVIWHFRQMIKMNTFSFFMILKHSNQVKKFILLTWNLISRPAVDFVTSLQFQLVYAHLKTVIK